MNSSIGSGANDVEKAAKSTILGEVLATADAGALFLSWQEVQSC